MSSINLRSELTLIRQRGARKIKRITSDQNVVKCLMKGCKFETTGNLVKHVTKMHGLNRTQYLIIHKLPYDMRLYGSAYGEYMREESNLKKYRERKKKTEN